MSHYRIGAKSLGAVQGATAGLRVCHRCGIEKQVNKRVDRTKPYMCGECKIVDPVFAKRFGIS